MEDDDCVAKNVEVGEELGLEGAWRGGEEARISSVCDATSASHQAPFLVSMVVPPSEA